MISRKSILIIAISALILTSIPAIFVAAKIYPMPFVVPVGPYGEGDYYYDRIKEIKDGYPLLGNPYFYEHREEIAPTFFVADWVAAIPALLGIPLMPATLINFLFWSFAAVFILALFLKKSGIGERWAVFGAIYCYLSIYLFMIRPVSMQIVFPFFFLFLLAYLYWWQSPNSKKTIIFLSATAAFSAYLYTYNAEIIIVMYVLSAIYFLATRNWRFLKSIAYSIAVFAVMIIPLIIFTLKQTGNPFYWQTMVRIGLVNTHLPTALFFISGFFVLAGLAALFFIWFSQKTKNIFEDRYPLVFFIITSIAILGISGSNIITGKDLENTEHLERYIIPWLALTTILIFWLLFKQKLWNNFKSKMFVRAVLIISLVVIAASDVWYLRTYGPTSVLSLNNRGAMNKWKKTQTYVTLFHSLDEKAGLSSVVWANPEGDVNSYIAMLSKQYPLFHMGGILHFISNQEAEERYMVSRYFDLTEDDLKTNFKLYAGAGNAIHVWKTSNREVKICQLLLLNKLGIDCGKIYDAMSWKGKKYFDDLYRRFETDIKPNIKEYLKKYHVQYAIKDLTADAKFNPEELGARVMYTTGNFAVYSFENLGN
jgi:hypothetical protein